MKSIKLLVLIVSVYPSYAHAMIYHQGELALTKQTSIRVAKKKHRQKQKHFYYMPASFCECFKEPFFNMASFFSAYSSVQQVAQALSAVARTNHFLNDFVNDKARTLAWIKQVSRLFTRSDIEVARLLPTKEANNRFALQLAFRMSCKVKNFVNAVTFNLKKLQRIGVDLDFSYRGKETILLETIRSEKYRTSGVVAWLINNGADINVCTSTGKNASMIALNDCNLPLIKLFLEHPKFESNHQDNKGNSPLHCCFFGFQDNGYMMPTERCKLIHEISKKLLQRGANPTVKNTQGWGPLDLARSTMNEALMALMETAVKEWNAQHLAH